MNAAGEDDGAAGSGGALGRWRWVLLLLGPVVILGLVAYFVLTRGRFESTDDAYVQVGKAPVSASVAGRVIDIDVKENQPVRKGQVLFRLDPADLQVAADRADAALANARLQVVSLRSAYDQQKLILAADLRTQAYSDKEAARQRALADAGVASRQQADEAAHAADLAAAAVDVARQQAAAALANLGPAVKDTDAYPAVMQAKAAREAAGLDLTHTIIIASQDGVVTRVDQLQLGAYINTSQTVFWLLSGQPWVAANFKEDQLAKMRVGQPATIKIDALGGREFSGHVDSFSPGAGDSFSPLPAQNATGNWVKVVQRLPVRISFDKAPPDIAARAGLSTKVTVDVRSALRSTPAPQG